MTFSFMTLLYDAPTPFRRPKVYPPATPDAYTSNLAGAVETKAPQDDGRIAIGSRKSQQNFSPKYEEQIRVRGLLVRCMFNRLNLFTFPTKFRFTFNLNLTRAWYVICLHFQTWLELRGKKYSQSKILRYFNVSRGHYPNLNIVVRPTAFFSMAVCFWHLTWHRQ